MKEQRRHFLGNAAITFFAAKLVMIGSADAQVSNVV
jgi:hypothetical protein